MGDFAVILPAAGRSSRFGGPTSKIFAELGGRTVLCWAIGAFAQRADVGQVVIATNDEQAIAAQVATLGERERKKIVICQGGQTRAESVQTGLEKCSAELEWVAVHDAARPLASQRMIDRVFNAAREHGCAVPAMPVHLTIKQAVGPLPAAAWRTIPRHELWAMQTPQAMRREDLLRAYETCALPMGEVTDDAQLIELAGKAVWLVEGEERNIKITTPMDLSVAGLLVGKG